MRCMHGCALRSSDVPIAPGRDPHDDDRKATELLRLATQLCDWAPELLDGGGQSGG